MKPNYAETHNSLGNALLQKGRVDEAIVHFQKAVEIEPDAAVAHYCLAIALVRKGRLDEAITHYQKAVKIQPSFVDAHINLGNALQQTGRVEEAITEYQKALEVNPANPTTQISLAWLLATAPQASLRNGGKAVELARQASALTGGENPAVLHTLAAACAEAGRFSEAVETAQHALRVAQAHTNTVLAGALQTELKLYQAGSPLHGPDQPH
jgi:Flp pilus assembly protein TadD